MTDARQSTEMPADESMQRTAADAVTNPAMAPMDDDAGGPTAAKEQADMPGDDEAGAQLGELS